MPKTKHEQIFGLHAVQQVFESDFSRVVELWGQKECNNARLHVLLDQAKQLGITIQLVPKKTLDKLSENGNHQGIMIRCKPKSQAELGEIIDSLTVPAFLLVLDSVQDPHNLGACLRTADAVGIHALIVPKNQACKLSAIVHKVASGATQTVPVIQVTNLAGTLCWLKDKGVWLIGADEASQTSIFETKLTGSLAFVLGGEGEGLRRLTRDTCDSLVHIPMLGKVKSLNVSVATGVCLFEAVRQRITPVVNH